MSNENMIASQRVNSAGITITKCKPGVAQGLKKTDYIAREYTNNFGNRKPAVKLETGDAKYDMYLNALPAAIRETVHKQGLDVRALYKEYRQIKAAGMIAKYGEK